MKLIGKISNFEKLRSNAAMREYEYKNAIKFILTSLIMINLLGCEATAAFTQHSFIDVKLIGVWKGQYREKDGTIKNWLQTRKADGTYIIKFSFVDSNGTVKSFTEAGRWWIQNNLFHEMALSDMRQPDKYKYFFDKKACVNFELVENTMDYAFSECLTADSPPATIGNGLFEIFT